MGQSKRTIQELKGEIGRDFNSFIDDFYQNLRAATPIRSGNARSKWVKTGKDPIKSNGSVTVLRNTVDYADRLDKGWSSQAPRGIVDPAYNRTRKK